MAENAILRRFEIDFKRGLGKGMSDDTPGRMGEITGEMLVIWGRQDPHVPREGRQLIYNAMNEMR